MSSTARSAPTRTRSTSTGRYRVTSAIACERPGASATGALVRLVSGKSGGEAPSAQGVAVLDGGTPLPHYLSSLDQGARMVEGLAGSVTDIVVREGVCRALVAVDEPRRDKNRGSRGRWRLRPGPTTWACPTARPGSRRTRLGGPSGGWGPGVRCEAADAGALPRQRLAGFCGLGLLTERPAAHPPQGG